MVVLRQVFIAAPTQPCSSSIYCAILVSCRNSDKISQERGRKQPLLTRVNGKTQKKKATKNKKQETKGREVGGRNKKRKEKGEKENDNREDDEQ
jgi:hypothetical protein